MGFLSLFAVGSYQNCGKSVNVVGTSSLSYLSTPTPGPIEPVVAGGGAKLTGSGALTVPTATGTIAKIENGLQGNVSSISGNFSKAVIQLKTNLPQVSDPTKATGFDQIQLLVYAACSDLTTGSPSKMQSVYKVDPAKNITTNKSALLAAGITMLDQYVAKLASQGPTSTQVSAAVNKVIDQISAGATNTTKIAFMSVCIAVNTAGTTLMGF
jgi:hypothetical protein